MNNSPFLTKNQQREYKRNYLHKTYDIITFASMIASLVWFGMVLYYLIEVLLGNKPTDDRFTGVILPIIIYSLCAVITALELGINIIAYGIPYIEIKYMNKNHKYTKNYLKTMKLKQLQLPEEEFKIEL